MSKILIVDDEAEILNPLEEMLLEEGFEVAFANKPKHGFSLHICRSSNF